VVTKGKTEVMKLVTVKRLNIKPNKLKSHLETVHAEYVGKAPEN
jgi:hypothetical protein